jgi:hypothetical protein
LPLKEGKKEGNNVLLIQQAGRLFGRNVVLAIAIFSEF